MPMWRCPHCGTPQAETARCWVCHRSSTACLTCRHYRRSVAAKIGFCGLDAHRLPLLGDEIRACWESGPLPSAPTITAAASPEQAGAGTYPLRVTSSATAFATRPAKRSFVEVGMTGPNVATPGAESPPEATVVMPEESAPRWSLWED